MKKAYLVLLIALLLWVAIFATDYLRASNNRSPIFSIPITSYDDGGSTEYYGLGYKVIKYVELTLDGVNVVEVDIGTWNLEFSHPNVR